MSTIKTTNIAHGSKSGTANLVLDDTGKVSIAEKKLYCPGTIIQVVYATSSTQQTLSANDTYTDLGPTASITPTANTSKIKVTFNGAAAIENHNDIKTKIVRTKGGSASDIYEHVTYSSDTAENNFLCCMITIDDPYGGSGTVGELNYKMQMSVATNYGQVWWQYGSGTSDSTIILEEIAG